MLRIASEVVQWNLNNPAIYMYGPGFIGRNSEVAGVQC